MYFWRGVGAAVLTAVLALVPLVIIKSMATTRRKAKGRTGEENEGLPRGGRGIFGGREKRGI